MREELDPLVLDLVEWVARESRPYKEVLDVWRTSCPRLTVWEDAIDRGFVTRTFKGGQDALVEVTAAGHAFLIANGRRVHNNEQGITSPVQASVC
ncbi:MAG: hypothetical protein AAGD43_24435 [Pseudomonadota bacterium]